MTPDEKAALPYRPCAGVMLVNADGYVFTGQRIGNHQAAWQMPQGGIDPGEDPREAAIRELWEETGVSADLVRVESETADWLTYDLPEDLIGVVWKGRYRGQRMKWFLLRFLGQDADVNIATDHPEFGAWRWSSPETLSEDIVPFKRAVYERVVEEFKDQL